MAYCRFSENSDVYLFTNGYTLALYRANNRDEISFPLDTEGRTLCRNYLLKLREEGKQVPQRAIDRLSAEIKDEPFKTDIELTLESLGYGELNTPGKKQT